MTPRPELGRRSMLHVLVAGTVFITMPALAEPSAADAAVEQVELELVVLYGVKDGQKLLPSGYPELLGEPWGQFDHYEIVSRKRVTLRKGKLERETLPDGWTLESALIELAPPKLQLVMRDPKGEQHLSGKYPAPRGVRLLPAAYPHKNGRAVVALTVL